MSEYSAPTYKSQGFANTRIPFDKGEPYTCPELQRNPGMCDSRFVAYHLPSMINGKRVEPKRKP